MISVKRFGERHIEEAGWMFAEKYKRLRRENELLPEEFTDEKTIQSMLGKTIREHPAAVAVIGNRVVGYLTGFSDIKTFKGSSSGVYVPVWGHSIEDRENIEEIYPALYREMSAEWIRRHCYTQAVSFFVPDYALQELLFGLGFGLLVIDGVRDLSPLDIEDADADDIEIREARESDLVDIMSIDRKLRRYLRKSPIFLNVSIDEADTGKVRSEFLGEDIRTFIAKQGNEVVSCMRGVLNMGDGCDLLNIDGSLGINFAYTNMNVRGKGIATLLLNELVKWGSRQGMRRCVVDFESANLPGRTFWMRHFRPVFYSVIRRVDDRV